MKLIIFGPPGSGKGTYSSLLKKKIGIEKFSIGDYLRAEVKKQSELGKMIEKDVNSGRLIPDDIVINIMKDIIDKMKDNFILDGFPRTVRQAEWLINYVKIDGVIKIKVHDEVLIEKISGRRVCSNPSCDGNYNVVEINRVIENVHYILPPLLPKRDMICDKCGSKLIQRADDRPEIVRERLKIYYSQTTPVEDFLRSKKIKFVEVWMNRDPESVVNEMIEKMKESGIL